MDMHCEKLLAEFAARRETLLRLRETAVDILKDALSRAGVGALSVESRVKTSESLAGKLERKGQKYRSTDDITDLVGVRVVTFYQDEIDKVAALVEHLFDIDWDNSVDKRKALEVDRFGYMSLHYICRIPKTVFCDETCPALNEVRFELQIRTALQHIWATLNHDNGYKTDVDIPQIFTRRLVCLAGVLELADREFLGLRLEIEEYRRKIGALISDGAFDSVPLDGDSFTHYLEGEPFRELTERIASVNHAEIEAISEMPYLAVLRDMGFTTLGDAERLKHDYAEDAFLLARHELGNTDLDILSSTLGLQSLCAVYLLKNGKGREGILRLFTTLYGDRPYNAARADRIMDAARRLNLVEGD